VSVAHEAPSQAGLNPFPGLRPFEPDEDYLFFGREQQTDELLRKLRTTRFLSILGTSGSGKSSLVRSGLIPSLYGGAMTRAGSQWRVAILRPGDDPLGNLAAALAGAEALGGGDDELNRAFFETTLRSSSRGLLECIRQARLPAGDNVLVLVDQFEELFRFKRTRRLAGRDEALAFVKLLLAARESQAPCYIALTMRSDFIGDCMEFPRLPEVINEGIYLVPRMSREELRSAITGPVAVGGAAIAPRLVSSLLNDVGDDPDQLPILQHALMRTWERWRADHRPGEPLDLRHYEAIGTMASALDRHAEEAYDELRPDEQPIAEKLFKALTDKETDLRGVRRPVPLSEICALTGASVAAVAAVVERFRAEGRTFLMPPTGTPLHEGSILDISHESLMRVWKRLSDWAGDEARSGQTYLTLARAAERHAAGTAALWRDPELQNALSWRANERPTEAWAARYDPSFERAMQFLDASQEERDRELREKEARRRRELRQARALVAILGTASLVTLVLGGFAFSQKTKAERALKEVQLQSGIARQQASRADREKIAADAERLKAEGQSLIAKDQAKRADAAAKIAGEQRANAVEQSHIAQKQTEVAHREEEKASAATVIAQKSAKDAEAQKVVAEKARTAAVKSADETRRLSHLAAARALALSIANQNPANAAVLALEMERLHRESGGRAQDPNVFTAMRIGLGPWDPHIRHGYDDAVRALAVASDRHTLFTGGDDGSILRIDLDQDGEPAVVARLGNPVRSLSLRGDLLAVGTAGGVVAVLNLRNPGSPPRQLAAGGTPVTSVAFQPSGSLLAAAGRDGSLRLWNVNDTAAPPTTIRIAGVTRLSAVAFSPDGRTLAAGASDAEGIVSKGARLWHVDRTGEQPQLACYGSDIRSMAFRPDGRVLACGIAEGLIIQDTLGSDLEVPTPLVGHNRSVNSLTYDAHGDYLASAGSDGTVRIWDAKVKGVQSIVLPGHDSWVWSVAFAPNGKQLISGGQDRTIRIWQARTEALAEALCKLIAPGKHYPSKLSPEEWSATMPADFPYRDTPICQEP
jgi:WD40 repeat protein/energy-coupling factor transporter ATP-binding protein EcfA2